MEPWYEYSRFFIALLAILDPFAAVPIFVALATKLDVAAKKSAANAAAFTVFLVLTIAALSGEVLLTILGTSLDAVRVGGGIVLLLMALSMLNAEVSAVQKTEEEMNEAADKKGIGVVPIGLPLLAGPGAISTTVIQSQRSDNPLHTVVIIGCILAVCLAVWVSLRLAEPIGRKLGVTGLNILNRLLGLLLAAVAVQIMANGLRGLFPGWT